MRLTEREEAKTIYCPRFSLDAGALWVAAKYEIPLLIVMFNNRAYYNDWELD